MKRFILIFLLFILPMNVFCMQETEFRAAAFISICAFGYYQEHGIMPENIFDLQEKEYFENTRGHFKVYYDCGFEINLQKRNDNTLDIYVSSQRMQYHVRYEVETFHHFLEYLNGKFIKEYYRDNKGYIITASCS